MNVTHWLVVVCLCSLGILGAPLQAANTEPPDQASNRALQVLIQLDHGHPSAALNTAIADRYYALGQYGWAILYYRRALALEPRSQSLEMNLRKSHEPLGIPYSTPTGWVPISENEKIVFTLALLGGLILVLSAIVWLPNHRFLHAIAAPLALLALAACVNLLYDHYGAPVEAILVRSTLLRESPEEQGKESVSQPLLEGSVVEVLGTVDQGRWLKIQASDGRKGYVTYPSIRII